MYQIIQLQPDDDLAAIRARIEISELARVILIVPRDCATLESVSGLQLLRRASDDLATPLALVAHNDYVRAHATEFGFPVFNSLTQAQNTKWRMGESKRESNPHRQEMLSADIAESKRFAVTPATIQNWRGAMIAAIIALVLLGVVAFFFVPTAQVRLVPSAVALTTSTDVIVDSSILQVTAATHSIPARRLNREISGTLQLRMTTTKTIPDARSTGNVTFSNLRAEEIAIPPGTIVKTSAGVPIRFTTLTTATLPGGLNQRVDAAIQAVDPGPTGNVKELAINSVEGSLGLSMRVINTKPTVSGTLRPVKVVTADDKKKLQDQLLAQLTQQAPGVLQAMLKPGESIAQDSIQVDINDTQFDHNVDDPADLLNLKMTANAFGLAVDGDDLKSVMQLILQQQMQPGYQFLPNGVQVDMLKGGKFQGIQLRQPVRAVGYTTPQIDVAKVAAALPGKSVDEAKTFLASRINLAQPPDIRLTPAGWFRMPWFAFRIAVFVESPTVNQ